MPKLNNFLRTLLQIKLLIKLVQETQCFLLWIMFKIKNCYNLTLLISSLAAAQSVESIGNKNTIKKLKILKTLESILK